MFLRKYQEQYIACKFYDLYNCVPKIRYIVKTASVKEEEEHEPASEEDVKLLVKEALETNCVTEFAESGLGLNQNIDELSLPGVCCIVLEEANPFKKAALSLYYAKLWFDKKLKLEPNDDDFYPIPPDTPARDVKTVDVNLVPKRGGAGNKKNVIGLVHSLAHIENVAIDLSWDIITRFMSNGEAVGLPMQFYNDWVKVAEDEARHFLIWSERLRNLGSYYGALSTHDKLWESARKTSDSLVARLAIEHMALEGRGLDVYLNSVKKFIKGNDQRSASLLTRIYLDEITHVKAGVTWFEHIMKQQQQDPVNGFKIIIDERFDGKLKPPFNHKARSMAGMKKEYYCY
eukprot:g6348.t1